MSSTAVLTLAPRRIDQSLLAKKMGFASLNFLATVHVVWFYLTRTTCEIQLPLYEQGLERTPFQYRLLLMAPLRWAHQSHLLQAAAAWLTRQPAWFPRGVRAEGLLEAVIDILSVGITGLLTRQLYLRVSRTRLLAPYIYPLTLLMVLSTYALMTFHAYRFIADLPALAIFSLGLYLIYTRAHWGWFALVFLVGTANRETTLLLLLFYLLAEGGRTARFKWQQAFSRSTLAALLPLALAWVAWHLWVVHRFAANPSGSRRLAGMNLTILAVPFAWTQLLCACGYLLPCVLAMRRGIEDAILRRWLIVLPVWFMFMIYYGVIVETRIFGELIPYVACASALIAEEALTMRLGHLRSRVSEEVQ